MEILEVIKCALIITAIHVVMWDGMILEGLRAWLDRLLYDVPREINTYQSKTYFKYKVLLSKFKRGLKNPLYECIICMASIWGTAFYFLHFSFHLRTYIEFILQVAGINTLIVGIIHLAYISNSEDIERNTPK